MVIIDKSAPGAMELIALRDLLLSAQNKAEQLQRQVAASTDAQITELHGIPSERIAEYKSVLLGVLGNLQAEPIELLLGNVA